MTAILRNVLFYSTVFIILKGVSYGQSIPSSTVDKTDINNSIIIYDAKTGYFIKSCSTVNEGSYVTFTVKNINPFLNTIKINKTLYSNRAPTPDKYNFAKIEPVSVDQNLVSKTNLRTIDSAYNKFVEYYDSLTNFINIGNDLNNLIKLDVVEADSIHSLAKNTIKTNFSKEEMHIISPPIFVNKISRLYKEFVNSFFSFQRIYKQANDSIKAEYKTIYNKSETIFSSINNIGIDSLIAQANKDGDLYFRIINESFTRSLSVQATNDVDIIKFSVEKVSKEENSTLVEAEVYVTGGFRINFSTGLVMSGLADDEYTMIDTTFKKQVFNDTVTVNGKAFYKNDLSNTSFGIAGLTNFTYQLWKIFAVGVNLGISLNTTLNPQYLAGVSLMIGSDQRFVICGGVAMGKVQRLAQPYKEKSLHEYSQNTLPYVNVYDNSWYVGLTFSIGSRSVKKE